MFKPYHGFNTIITWWHATLIKKISYGEFDQQFIYKYDWTKQKLGLMGIYRPRISLPVARWIIDLSGLLLSGKLPHSYGKSPFSKEKSTISMAMFNSFLYVYQRVNCLKRYSSLAQTESTPQRRKHGSPQVKWPSKHWWLWRNETISQFSET